jgi:5-methylcytosine-specific restriction protein A
MLMSRDKRYQRLLNSPKWREVKKMVWQRANGLCERCKAEGGFIKSGVDCHHIIPVESANPDIPGEMERLAYDVNNIQLLCVPCHIKVHQDMHTHTKEKVQENKERARKRFMEANDPNWRPDEPTD